MKINTNIVRCGMFEKKHNSRDYEQVSGVFEYNNNLQGLIDTLNSRGISGQDVSILMSDRTKNQHFAPSSSSKSPEGATAGSVSGGLLGALLGGLAIAGTLSIPGLGMFVAGPIVGALAGGAVGTATGGLIGALVGAGIPEFEAKYYEDALREQGKVLIVAHVPKIEANEIRAVFERFGAHRVKVK